MDLVFPKNIELKNFKVKIVSTQNIHFKKSDIRKYYKKTPIKEIPKKVKFLNSIKQFENFLKSVKKKDIIFFWERSYVQNKLNNYDLKFFKKYKIRTIDFNYYPEISPNFKKQKILNTFKFIHLIYQNIFKKFYSFSSFKPDYVISFGELAKQRILSKKSFVLNHFDCPSIWI